MEKKKTQGSKSMTGISTTVPKENDFSAVSAEMHTTEPAVSTDEYSAAFGEKLTETLNLDTWHPGADLVEMYARLESEITNALKEESKYQKDIREKIFPKLRTRTGAPPSAGVYRVGVDRLENVHKQILFNGGVEACDGIVVAHDTLPITIIQIGVCLVSYRGDQGSWVHRIYRRDLRSSSIKNPVDETLELLERRRRRGAIDQKSERDYLTALGRRGIMAYAERAVLLDRSDSVWRMGHGNPTPYELVTGSGMVELVRASLKLMKRFILEHKRFIFVPSSTSARELLTIGNALNPLEYAIVDTNRDNLDRIARGHYRGEAWGDVGKEVDKFVDDVGSKIVVGMYRASKLAPAQMFYAHVDYVEMTTQN